MSTVKIFPSQYIDEIRPMHAVNNGPIHQPGHPRRNFENFQALKIPYSRNHDASLTYEYGCQHVVDVHCIFPDFSRDVDDESAYDFPLTDAYVKTIFDAGTEVFYRLGTSIEHWHVHYGTLVPPDFRKWAQICEHIIMHYTEGWANGFNYNIKYWEIWNEPDYSTNGSTWCGTKEEFFEFYNVAASYLKNRFPNLKIGGPALSDNFEWAEEFLSNLTAPLDFFSYHLYAYEPEAFAELGIKVKKLLEKHGYNKTECILNEWNYVKSWSDPIDYIKAMKGIKGAAFTAAAMCVSQNCKVIDMLMYYDARITTYFNGLFDSDTLEILKGYYPFLMFSELYQRKNQIKCESDDKDIYVLGAANDENSAVMITYYTTDEDAKEKNVIIDFDKDCVYECLLLDNEHDMTLIKEVKSQTEITMKPDSVILLREK